MLFVTGLLRTFILLGALQGFILGSLLFFSKKKRSSNRILSALIFLISLASFNLYGNFHSWFNTGLWEMIPMIIVMPIGPLIYFYTRSFLDPSFKMSKKERFYFFPVILDLMPSITILIFLIIYFTKTIKPNPSPWGNFIDTYNTYVDIPRWMSITFYLWLSHKYLLRVAIKNNSPLNGQATDYKWLRQFIRVFLAFQVIWFLFLIPYVIPKYYDTLLNAVGWYPIYIPLAIIIYWLGIKGYIVSQQENSAVKKSGSINSQLTASTISEIVSLLKGSMEEDKLYLNPNLSVNMVSGHIDIAPKTISAVLNQHMHKSFNEFVNEYRVEAFKVKILQPDMNNMTITGIAFDCGFNSQATFQRTFKQFTGLSPSAFRDHVMESE
ncbi:MAG TPA: helix-turn-helix transcriptional regulator [Puia sp.]|nr:helix-turn-helix transcriptional regulator [Puia sp.]